MTLLYLQSLSLCFFQLCKKLIKDLLIDIALIYQWKKIYLTRVIHFFLKKQRFLMNSIDQILQINCHESFYGIPRQILVSNPQEFLK